MIRASNVSKRYGNIQALNKVSLDVQSNTIFALLGQNGAGKTTLVKSLLNLIRINEGEITINGKSPSDETSRKGIAYLPEKFTFFPYYSVAAILEFYCNVKEIPKDKVKEQISYAMEKLNITALAKRKVSTLSKGQLQRLGIATTLIGPPSLLIWDEPFTGLDPIGIRDIKVLVKELTQKNITLFINSHILSEIEQICDHIAIVDQGECIAQGAIDDLKKNSSLEEFFCNTVGN